MADLVNVTLLGVNAIVGKYESVKALKEECAMAGEEAESVREIVTKIKEAMDKVDDGSSLPAMKMPLTYFRDGVKEIHSVIDACTLKPVRAFFLSKTYLNRLRAATGKIKDAKVSILTSGAAKTLDFQSKAAEALARTNERLDKIDESLRQSDTNNSIPAALNYSPKAVSDFMTKVQQLGLAATEEDAREQLRELQRDHSACRREKYFADGAVLDLVCALSLYDQSAPPAATTLAVEPPQGSKCPITLDIMRDPVFLHTPAGRSYEQCALEEHLHRNPDQDPITGERYTHALQFSPNRTLKDIIEAWRHANPHYFSAPQTTRLPTPEAPRLPPTQQESAVPFVSQALNADEAAKHLVAYAQDPAARISIARALATFCENGANVNLAREAATIRTLITMLGSRDDAESEVASRAIKVLALKDKNKIPIAKAGAITLLVTLLQHGSDTAKENAAEAIEILARNSSNSLALAYAAPTLVALLHNGTSALQSKAAATLATLADNFNNVVSIAKAGAIPPLAALLQTGTDEAKERAARAFRNLSFLNEDSRVSIAKAGAIPPLVALLQNGRDRAKEHVIATLYNLASTDENKLSITEAGAIPVLVASRKTGSRQTKYTAAEALKLLGYEQPPTESCCVCS